MMRYFDLHCDTVTELKGESLRSNRSCHISLDRAPERYVQGYAIFIPDDLRGDDAFSYYKKHVGIFKAQTGGTDSFLTVESGAVLGGRLDRIEALARDGVRMLTLTWNGRNELGCGAMTDDTTHLTPFGKAAVNELERCGIVVDVSHLNDAGFEDVCETASKPFVASHSNAYSVYPHKRNLKDWQIKEIVNRKGLIGVNIYSSFLSRKNAVVADIYRHIEHILSLEGGDALAFGADFDGMKSMPKGVTGIESIPFIRRELSNLGVADEMLEKIFYDNAARFFDIR